MPVLCVIIFFMKTIKDLNIAEGTRVLLRLDFNVPINESGEIENTFRIDESLSTIKYLQDLKAKTIIIAHKESGSLVAVAKYLSEKIGNVKFLDNSNSDKVFEIQDGGVVLLENIRLDEREKSKDTNKRDELAQELANLADVYINDAFSASHRDHASITSIPKYLPSSLGPNFIREVTELSKGLNPEHPSLLIVGGAKFDTKLAMLEKFNQIADKIFVGGALAHTFWKATGQEIGTSLLDEEVKLNEEILKSPKINLPTDILNQDNQNKNLDEIVETDKIMDFGNNTLVAVVDMAKNSNTVIWNGPLGFYEKGFDMGTRKLIVELGQMQEKTIILGGGDTVAVVEKVLKENPNLKFTHVSGAGGAMIDFLSNGTLPGILAVESSQK